MACGWLPDREEIETSPAAKDKIRKRTEDSYEKNLAGSDISSVFVDSAYVRILFARSAIQKILV